MINIQSAIEVFAEEYEKLSQIERNILQKGLKEKDLDIAENPTTYSLLKKILKWEVEQMAKEKEKEKKDLTTTTETKPEPIKITKEDIKKYLCPKATDTDLYMALGIIHSLGLNPFKREVHIVKYQENKAAQVVTGYEVYLKRAERSGRWNGYNMKIEGTGMDMRAVVTIYRKDWKEPLIHSVKFKEYAQYKGDGGLNKFWREKPETMLKKVAISQGFKLAFPDECGGLPYIPEEIKLIPEEDGKVIVQGKTPILPKIEVETPKETPRDKRKKVMDDIKRKCKETGKDFKKITSEIKKELAISGKALDSPEVIWESFRSRVWSEVLKNKK